MMNFHAIWNDIYNDAKRPQKTLSKSNTFILFTFFILAIVLHAIVLKFIFPGYYSPLYPHHTDFYLPAAFANAPGNYYSFFNLLTWPRPVYLIIAKFFGLFGIHGGIAWIIALVCMNTALSALLVKRILTLPFNGLLITAFAAYCFLLFSQPFFYTFYTQDLGAHLCYLFLLLGTHFFLSAFKSVIKSNIILLFFCLLAFLSKETYGITALSFAFMWFIYYRKTSFIKSFLPIIMVGASFVIAFIINVYIKSVFVDLNATGTSPYHISTNPGVILREWLLYLKEAINIANAIMIILLILLVVTIDVGINPKMVRYFTVSCLIAACVAWIPNSILPNHHFKGYSFSGLPLLFLPLFPVFASAENIRKAKALIIIIALCIVSPLFNIGSYKGEYNQWVLDQEKIQRNLLAALDSLISNLKQSDKGKQQKILITGITFPFQPFTYPESLRVFPNAAFAQYDVTNIDPAVITGKRTDLVKFIGLEDVRAEDYDQKWVFNSDGKLLKSINTSFTKKERIPMTWDNMQLFKTRGFYGPENGIAWTNGDASIDIDSSFARGDSILVEMSTYMPPVCKDITPKVFLSDSLNNVFQPSLTRRKDDIFYYLFIFNENIRIKRINMLADKINDPSIQRVLSFPFTGIEIKKYSIKSNSAIAF